jgi:hypothetical protein
MSEKIPASRVPFLDITGLISREWYRYFNDLFKLTGASGNNVSLMDLQTAPVFREPTKTRREVLPFSPTMGASPFYYTNKSDTEMDALFIGGTITNIEFTRDGSTFYNVGAPRSMVRLSPFDSVLVVYTSAPSLVIIPR